MKDTQREKPRGIGLILYNKIDMMTWDRVDPIATAYVCMGGRASAAARKWLTSSFA